MVILKAKDLLEQLLELRETDLGFDFREIKVDIGNSNSDLDVIGLDLSINNKIIILTTD